MKAPSFSVILPTWNGARFLAAALESVAAQTMTDYELLVVDDGSTDDSVAIATAAGAGVIVRSTRGGVAAARNEAVRAARGRYLAFLDQDDLWAPECLAVHADALERVPAAVSIVHEVMFLEPTMQSLPAWFGRPELLAEPHAAFVPSGMAFARETFERVGWFDESFQHASDLDWFARARALAVPFEISPRAVLRRRIHEENDSRNLSAKREMFVSMQRHAARKRESQKGQP